MEHVDVAVTRPALDHLRPLGIVDAAGRVAVAGTRAVDEPRLWLLGHGNGTGFASATLSGTGRWSRQTVEEFRSLLTLPAAA